MYHQMMANTNQVTWLPSRASASRSNTSINCSTVSSSPNDSVNSARSLLPKSRSTKRKRPIGWEKDAVGSGRSSTQLLLDWYTTPGNFERWRGDIGGDSATKREMAKEILTLLRAEGITHRNEKGVIQKILEFHDTYAKAYAWKQSMEQYILDQDKVNGVQQVQEHVVKICKHWDRLDPILSRYTYARSSTRPASKHTSDAVSIQGSSFDEDAEVIGDLEDEEDQNQGEETVIREICVSSDGEESHTTSDDNDDTERILNSVSKHHKQAAIGIVTSHKSRQQSDNGSVLEDSMIYRLDELFHFYMAKRMKIAAEQNMIAAERTRIDMLRTHVDFVKGLKETGIYTTTEIKEMAAVYFSDHKRK